MNIHNHAEAAAAFLKNEQRADWHDQSLWSVHKKREEAIKNIPEWEQLREIASTAKRHVLANLDKYLIEFEKNALKNNVMVHWAKNGGEHNEIIKSIIKIISFRINI